MMRDETTWELQPQAGWDTFRAARQRVRDVMWAESELHNIVRTAHLGLSPAVDGVRECQLTDATD